MTAAPLRILLIEDNEAHSRPMSEELQAKLAAQVTTVVDGEAGLSELAERPYDVVVMDFRLPDLDGLTVLEKIQNSGVQVPVVLVTGMGDELVAVRALKAGAYDYVVKGHNLGFVKRLPDVVDEARRSFQADRKRQQVVDQLHEERRRLAELSLRDDLTELYNRRHLSNMLPCEFARAKRYGYPLSLMMTDIDGLKAINSQYGHDCGSAVIRHVATITRQAVRISDQAFRYGGDEYLLLLPNTGKAGAITLGDRLCLAVAHSALEFEGRSFRLTISAGVATFWEENYPSGDAVLRAADAALFEAKAQGGNVVVQATEQ